MVRAHQASQVPGLKTTWLFYAQIVLLKEDNEGVFHRKSYVGGGVDFRTSMREAVVWVCLRRVRIS